MDLKVEMNSSKLKLQFILNLLLILELSNHNLKVYPTVIMKYSKYSLILLKELNKVQESKPIKELLILS